MDAAPDSKNGEPVAMDDADVAVLANTFKLLTDPHRIRILHLLTGGDMTVTEFEEALKKFDGLDCTGPMQSGVSFHLGLLRDVGIIAFDKRGKHHAYRFADTEPLLKAARFLCAFVDDDLRRRIEEFLQMVERGGRKNGSTAAVQSVGAAYSPPVRVPIAHPPLSPLSTPTPVLRIPPRSAIRPQKLAEKQPRPKRVKVQDRTTEAKILLYERIDSLGREGIQLIDACNRVGITLSEHTYLSINVADFRREMIAKRKQQ
jgi:DNA-binding transcriptional ArsR family regulator